MAFIVDGGHPNNTIRFITTMNNNLTWFWFKLTTIMMFSYVTGKQRIGNNKNAGKSLAISVAMRMPQYDAGPIAQ